MNNMKLSKFQFLNPYLEEINFITNQNFNADDENMDVQNAFNVQVRKSEDSNRANVSLTLKINDENKNAPFRLKITVASDFKWEDLDDDMVNTMLKLNAPALLLGYMRPIVANITNSSKFPVYNIPFVNFKN